MALVGCSSADAGPDAGSGAGEASTSTVGKPAFDERVADFSGYPAITGDPGAGCLRVLAIGDSLMVAAQAQLADVLAETGRCAEVIGEARNSSGPIGDGGGVTWSLLLPELLAAHSPDVVAISFIGNSTVPGGYESERYELETRVGLLQLIDDSLASGAAVSVSVPPPAVWFCNRHTAETPAWRSYRRWVRDDLSQLRSEVAYADWNPFLGPNGYAHALRFPNGEVLPVREADCTHLLTLGAYQGAWAVAASIAPEWNLPAGQASE